MPPRHRIPTTDPLTRLRNEMDALGRPGMAGTSRVGFNRRGRGGGVQSVLANAGNEDDQAAAAGAAQLLVLSAAADGIASGGEYIAFDVNVAQHGFQGVTPTAGGAWVHPVTGVYYLDLEVAWDTYTGGGTVELELDGIVPAEGMIGQGSAGQQGRASIAYFAEAGQVGRIKVTQTSGSDQTLGATVRIAITDPSTDGTDEWVKVFTGDVYDLTHDGTNWWTTEGNSGITVSKRDASWAEVSAFEASAFDSVRGITHDGADLWIAGEAAAAANELLAEYSTAGSLLTSVNTGSSADGNNGAGWDGSHVWLIEGQTNDAAERYTTAGVLDSSFSLGSTDAHAACAWFAGHLYVVNETDSTLMKFDSDGTLVDTIDLSAAISAPTGVYITDDGTLYISKNNAGVWRRERTIS